jgi:hypothetical protein
VTAPLITYPSVHWLSFTDQWDPKSPWQDRRVRQAANLAIDRKALKREATLHRIQQLVQERAMVAPIYELAFLTGVGRRLEESALGLIAGYAFSAPYEDVKLRAK